jgi:cell division protein FtsL
MQFQWIGIFLLILVIIAAIAGVYLSVSERAATTGRQIQSLEEKITLLEIENNDLASQLASIKSIKNMQARVEDLDMIQFDPQQALYLEIPGYVPKEAAVLAPAARIEGRETPVLLPEFTASLWDWFLGRLSQPQNSNEVQP